MVTDMELDMGSDMDTPRLDTKMDMESQTDMDMRSKSTTQKHARAGQGRTRDTTRSTRDLRYLMAAALRAVLFRLPPVAGGGRPRPRSHDMNSD